MDYNVIQIIIGVLQILIGVPSFIIAVKLFKKDLKSIKKIIFYKTIPFFNKRYLLPIYVTCIIFLGFLGMITSKNEALFIYQIIMTTINMYNILKIFNYVREITKLNKIKEKYDKINKLYDEMDKIIKEAEEEHQNNKIKSFIK